MLRASAVFWTALRAHASAGTPKAALSSGFLIHGLPPPAIDAASRKYARMRNRSPPAARKEVNSESDSSSSDDEAVVKHAVECEDGLESEELECFVLDFGVGEEKNKEKKRSGADA